MNPFDLVVLLSRSNTVPNAIFELQLPELLEAVKRLTIEVKALRGNSTQRSWEGVNRACALRNLSGGVGSD